MRTKRIAALCLTGVLVLSVPSTSYAEVVVNGRTTTEAEHTGDIKNTSEESTIKVNEGDKFTIKGNIEQDNDSSAPAVTVEGKDSEISVEGNVKSTGSAVKVTEGSAEIKGNVNAEREAVNNTDGDVTVKGNVEASGNDPVIKNTNGNVTVKGDVTSTGSPLKAVVNNGGNLDIEGNITTNHLSTHNRPAVQNKDGKVTIKGNTVTSGEGIRNTKGTVEIEGDISSVDTAVYNNDGGTFVVNGSVSSSSDTINGTVMNTGGEITVNGNVSATEGVGVRSTTQDATTTINGNVDGKTIAVSNFYGTVNVNGDVSNEAKDNFTVFNIEGNTNIEGNVKAQAEAIMNYTGTVTVNGDVTAETNEYAKSLDGEHEHHYPSAIRNIGGNIVINGNVLTNEGPGTSITQFNSGTSTINGDIDSRGTEAIINRLGSEITVNGNVTSAGDGLDTDFSAKTTIHGDIVAENNGIEIDVIDAGHNILYLDKEEDPTERPAGTIIVNGTITSKSSNPIVFCTEIDDSGKTNLDCFPTIIVYKAESGAGKSVVKAPIRNGKYNSNKQKKIEEEISSRINYIIRRADSENATYDLKNTRMLEGYETARAKETIIINVSTAKGYTVSRITGGQAIAKKSSEGVWELMIPEGGGVTISVLVKTIEEAEKEGAIQKVIDGSSSKAETSADYIIDKVSVSAQDAAAGVWTADGGYEINGVKVRNQWVKIYIEDINAAVWFYFDENGNKLTGWQKLKDTSGIYRWYYLSQKPGVLQGACYINSKTPDGYKVDENGAWMMGGVVQEFTE